MHDDIRMNASLKITPIGDSAGVVPPRVVLARLRVGPGGTLLLEPRALPAVFLP